MTDINYTSAEFGQLDPRINQQLGVSEESWAETQAAIERRITPHFINEVRSFGGEVVRNLIPKDFAEDLWEEAAPLADLCVRPARVAGSGFDNAHLPEGGSMLLPFMPPRVQLLSAMLLERVGELYIGQKPVYTLERDLPRVRPLKLDGPQTGIDEHYDGTQLPVMVVAKGAKAVTTIRKAGSTERRPITIGERDVLVIDGRGWHMVGKSTEGARLSLNINDGTGNF